MSLIIINGPCGVGKSTIAQKLHESMPLSYLLDVDAVSRNISGYRKYKEERWELTQAVVVATLEAVLSTGRDCIVEKMIYAPETLDRYRKIAKRYGANVKEFILWATKSAVMKRAHERGWRDESLLTPEKCELFWEKINDLKNTRKKAIVIDTSRLKPDGVLERVQEALKK